MELSRFLAGFKVVARWLQGCKNAGNSYRVGTTLLHACNQRCTDQCIYTSHAKQPCFRMVKQSCTNIRIFCSCMRIGGKGLIGNRYVVL